MKYELINIHFNEAKKLVFFDIDSTLTSAVDHCVLSYKPRYMEYRESIYKD
jgi:phosphoserine phosphatase